MPAPIRTALLVLIATATCGCSGKGTAVGGATGATQVVARVDGTELTVSQLNTALAEAGVGAVDTAATRRVLERLVDEQLMVEQALAAKLDRTPEVLLRLEQARRRVLAEAWQQQAVFPHEAIPEPELRRFYDEHPAVFKERRVYRLAGFATQSATLPPAVAARLPSTHGSEAVRALLDANGVRYSVQELEQGADELALDLVAPLAAAQPGDAIATVHGEAQQAAVLVVESARSAPMAYADASATIEDYLGAQRRKQALADALARLRQAAKVEYVGSVGAELTSTDADHAAAGLKDLH